jgi:hypothetical protein
MATFEFLTKEDLKNFKTELIDELKMILKPDDGSTKTWLKSADVRRILKISPGTLQTLRVNGTLQYTKVGSTLYYKLDDINNILEKGMR